jgi:hypothetical protein
MDGYFSSHLRALIEQHKADTICEESGLAPKSCVETLADELDIKWKNIDLTNEERNLLLDRSDGDLVDLDFVERRENMWVVRISKAVTESGLLICGLCHALSIAQRLQGLFELTVHVYEPRRMYVPHFQPNIKM